MKREIIDFINWMSLLGIPGIFTIIVFLFKTLFKTINKIEILQKAQKAQMRSQLLNQYDYYMEQGYVEQIYLDDWINQYNAYHQLVGDNAILDNRKENLLTLPTTKS